MRFDWKRHSWIPVAAALALILTDAALLFSPPSLGTATTVRPDAMENVFAGTGDGGLFGFVLNGEWRPSRYSPWLHWLILAPFQAASGDPFAAVFGPWLATIALLALVFFTARMLAGNGVGALAASLTLLVPGVPFYAVCAMTEAPYCAFLFLQLLLWMRMKRDAAGPPGAGACLLYGVAAALCGAMRGTGHVMLLLPLAELLRGEFVWRERLRRLSALLLPSAFVLGASACFNAAAFGSPFRTGYHYWCPVPYEADGLTFRWDWLVANAGKLAHLPWTWITAAAGALCVVGLLFGRRSRSWKAHAAFSLLQSGALLALYLPYFFYDPRFFLPIPILLFGPALALLADLPIFRENPEWKTGAAWTLAVLVQGFAVNAIAWNHHALTYLSDGQSREFLTAANDVLPQDAAIVSPFDPLLTESLLARGERGERRRVIPLSRDLEYAGKLVAPRPVGRIDPPPKGPTDHCAEALLRNPNCERPYPEVALEGDRWLPPETLKDGRPLYLIWPVSLPPPVLKTGAASPVAAMSRAGFRLWLYP